MPGAVLEAAGGAPLPVVSFPSHCSLLLSARRDLGKCAQLCLLLSEKPDEVNLIAVDEQVSWRARSSELGTWQRRPRGQRRASAPARGKLLLHGASFIFTVAVRKGGFVCYRSRHTNVLLLTWQHLVWRQISGSSFTSHGIH